ncbi:hypothetical protein E2C01_044231 [Portunus trituberculatus]|uniref:Uncharacterized protein n=1 Tax=Portunus trituberculatus TaxID=210409 RepID=A0A5B7FZE7_PORTR|nr:hypothetical protein [Portunus trituberculatus]
MAVVHGGRGGWMSLTLIRKGEKKWVMAWCVQAGVVVGAVLDARSLRETDSEEGRHHCKGVDNLYSPPLRPLFTSRYIVVLNERSASCLPSSLPQHIESQQSKLPQNLDPAAGGKQVPEEDVRASH